MLTIVFKIPSNNSAVRRVRAFIIHYANQLAIMVATPKADVRREPFFMLSDFKLRLIATTHFIPRVKWTEWDNAPQIREWVSFNLLRLVLSKCSAVMKPVLIKSLRLSAKLARISLTILSL